MSISLELMPLEEKPPEPAPPKTMVVRYGYLREIGEFPSDIPHKVGCGTKLVLRTPRGTEIGEMLTTACGNGGCTKSITRDKLLAYIENSGARNYPFSEEGRVLRVATAQDLAEQARLDEERLKHLTTARDMVQAHRLAMKIVEVEHLLGGERVLFYFVSEHRVDFRSLVRDMAHMLHTRIELRQIGARDEARLTADYEKCGQHCCCKQFLKVLTPISMRAAKVQKATLDPTKISGRCGRLMCCLRYEDETYEELRKKLPKRNTRVRTEKGDGWVIDGQILTQLVLVQYDDMKREAVPMEKILEFDRPKPVLPDGRVMQTANDRLPPMADAPRRGNGPPAGNGPRGPRPRPGMPAQAPAGDPLAANGPTGGDLSTGDDLDDLIADAMDVPPIPSAQDAAPQAGPSAPGAAPAPGDDAQPGAPTPNVPQQPGARPPQGPRPPMPPRGPGGPARGPGMQGRGPGGPGQGRGNRPGGRPPQQQRGPQGFRPNQPRGPQASMNPQAGQQPQEQAPREAAPPQASVSPAKPQTPDVPPRAEAAPSAGVPQSTPAPQAPPPAAQPETPPAPTPDQGGATT